MSSGHPPKSSVIIPVYNRRETTLLCLDRLCDGDVLAWCEVIVVDDGSTDGTSEAVSSRWPGVRILRGGGDLWWAGAMQEGMDAVDSDSRVVIWLNDDCRPRKGTLALLARTAAERGAIAVGQAVTPRGFIYGGKKQSATGLKMVVAKSGSVESVDTFGGNCVAFPVGSIHKIGRLDIQAMPHFYADSDYGFRATRSGIDAFVVGDAWCDNDHNDSPAFAQWTETELSFGEIRETMHSKKSWLFWPARRAFYVRHWGLIHGYAVALSPYLQFYLMWGIYLAFGRRGLIGIRDFYRRIVCR